MSCRIKNCTESLGDNEGRVYHLCKYCIRAVKKDIDASSNILGKQNVLNEITVERCIKNPQKFLERRINYLKRKKEGKKKVVKIYEEKKVDLMEIELMENIELLGNGLKNVRKIYKKVQRNIIDVFKRHHPDYNTPETNPKPQKRRKVN